MNPHRKVYLERRLRQIMNALSSTQQMLKTIKTTKDDKNRLKGKIARLGKEKKAIESELGIKEEKPKKSGDVKEKG